MDDLVPANVSRTNADGTPTLVYAVNLFVIEALEQSWDWNHHRMYECLKEKGVRGWNQGLAKTIAMNVLKRTQDSDLGPVMLRRASLLLTAMTAEALERKLHHKATYEVARAHKDAVNFAAKASAEHAGNRVIFAGTFHGPATANASSGQINQTLHANETYQDAAGAHKRLGPASHPDDTSVPQAPGKSADPSAPPSTGGSSHNVPFPEPTAHAGDQDIRELQNWEESLSTAKQQRGNASWPLEGREKESGANGRSQQMYAPQPLPAEQPVAPAIWQAEARGVVKVPAEKDEQQQLGLARALKELTPNVQRRQDFVTRPPFANEHFALDGRQALHPATPNVANSFDAMCEFGSPLLPLRGSVNQENRAEGSATNHELPQAGAASAGHFSLQGRSSSLRKRSRKGMDTQNTLEQPPAKSAKWRYASCLKAWGVVFEMQKEFPDLTAQLSKLLSPSEPGLREAADGAQNALALEPPTAEYDGPASSQMEISPPKALSKRGTSLGANITAPAHASLPQLDSKTAALQAESSPTQQLTATREGEKEEGDGNCDGAADEGSPRNKKLEAQSGPFDYQLPQPTLEKGDTVNVQGGSRADKRVSLDAAMEEDAEVDRSASSSRLVLAAVRLADHAQPELESESPASPSLNPKSSLRAPSAPLHLQEEGRLPHADEQETPLSAPQAVSTFGSSLAVLPAKSVNAPGSNAVLEAEVSPFGGFEEGRSPENNGRKFCKKWSLMSDPQFAPQQESAPREELKNEEESREEKGAVLDEVTRGSGQVRSSGRYQGPMAAQNGSSGKLQQGGFGSQNYFGSDEKDEEEYPGGVSRHASTVNGTSWRGAKERQSEKQKGSAVPLPTGTPDNGDQDPCGAENQREKGAISLKDQQLELLGMSEAAADKKFGPWMDATHAFRRKSGQGGELFESFDRALDGIRAPTDRTFGHTTAQGSGESFFQTHAASPSYNVRPFEPRDLLFKDSDPSEVTKSVTAVAFRFNKETPLPFSRVNKSAPSQFDVQKLHSAEIDEEEGAWEMGDNQEESANGEEDSYGSIRSAERASDASAEGQTSAVWTGVNSFSGDDVTHASDHWGSQEGGLSLRPAAGEGPSPKGIKRSDVFEDENEKQGGLWARKSTGPRVGRYDNVEESPISAYKSRTNPASGALLPFQEHLEEAFRGFGRPSCDGNRRMSDLSNGALAGYGSEDSDTRRGSGLVRASLSDSDPMLVAQMAKILGKGQLPYASSESFAEDPLDWHDEESMEISAAYRQESESDEEKDDAESALGGFGTAGMNETNEQSLAAANSAHAGAVEENAVATRVGSVERSAAAAGVHAGEKNDAAKSADDGRQSKDDAESVKIQNL